MGRYQRGDEVCAIDMVDTVVTIVDPDGTKHVEQCADVTMARTRYRILVNQKLRDGWKLVVAPPEVWTPGPPAPVTENARNEALEAALLEDPENEAAWLVYGDWLQQQGDPRGTHIALRAAAKTNDLLAIDRLRKHEARYSDYLQLSLGHLGWGFLERVEVMDPSDLEKLIAAPAGRFISKVTVPWAARNVPKIVELLARVPTLRCLHIANARTVKTLRLDLSKLRILRLHDRVDQNVIDELARAELPKLQQLGITNTSGTVRPLMTARFPALSALHIDDNTGAPISAWIGDSPFASQLVRLVIPRLTDVDAFELVNRLHAGRLWRLAEIQIPAIDLELYRRIAAVVPQVGVPSDHFTPARE